MAEQAMPIVSWEVVMSRSRRTFLAAVALLAAATACAPDGPAADRSPPEPASTPESPATSATAQAPTVLPASPVEYATALFESWLRGDQASVDELAQPYVAKVLASRAHHEPAGWQGPQCEGAAGSTFCSWVRPDIALTIRVANEAASQREPHAGTGVTFGTAPDRVAIWPYTTAEEARNSQDQVDEGHSPWQLSAEAVALSYANAVLGWSAATADPIPGQESLFLVTAPQKGSAVEVQLVQPVRAGEGGIWAITRVNAIDPSAG
jgi:hypothetical protein